MVFLAFTPIKRYPIFSTYVQMAATSADEYPRQEPTKPVARGAFIVVEGLDRAGKTTQVKKLCDKLYASGRNIKTLRFPGKH